MQRLGPSRERHLSEGVCLSRSRPRCTTVMGKGHRGHSSIRNCAVQISGCRNTAHRPYSKSLTFSPTPLALRRPSVRFRLHCGGLWVANSPRCSTFLLSLLAGRYVGRSSQDWGCPAGGSYQGAFAHPPTALLHVPPQSGSPTWGRCTVAASSTLLRVLPREVTHVGPKSQIPLLWADNTRGGGPIAHPHQPPDSGAQGPGARPKALSCRHPHLGWFSVGVTRLAKARATGLACRGTHSRLLTRSSLRSSGRRGFKVGRCGWLVDRLMVEPRPCGAFLGMVASGRGASWCLQPMVAVPFRSVHAWLVWCWPACVRSVHCWVGFSAAVWLVSGCVCRLMVGWCVARSIALQPAPV